MSLADKFEAAATEVRTKLTKKPTNDELLKLYGLYKQAKEGDNTTAQPWMWQVEQAAKWNSWTSFKGVGKEDAMNQYIAFAEEMKTKYA